MDEEDLLQTCHESLWLYGPTPCFRMNAACRGADDAVNPTSYAEQNAASINDNACELREKEKHPTWDTASVGRALLDKN